jgi:integrase/recombinase XerD
MAVSIELDKRKMTKTGDNAGKYPIKIRVTFSIPQGKKNTYLQKRFPTGVYAAVNEFKKKEKDQAVIKLFSKAQELAARGIGPVEFERMLTKSGNLEEIKPMFEMYIERLRDEERDGTAMAYKDAMNSFINYAGEYITYGQINRDWLKKYERHMVGLGRSINTIGMYCRALRAIFNLAASDGYNIVDYRAIPFGRRKYVIPSRKRALKKSFSLEQKNMILNYKSDVPGIARALDFWIFQYFCNGCNMADVAYLQYKNIEGDYLVFDRKKTENTERQKESIVIYVAQEIRRVIADHGNVFQHPDDYVFPILTQGLTSKQRKERIKDFVKEINSWLDHAGQDMKLPIKLTTGTTRYTAATILDMSGVDRKTIGKGLGHGSEVTTEKYVEGNNRDAPMIISKALGA